MLFGLQTVKNIPIVLKKKCHFERGKYIIPHGVECVCYFLYSSD